MSEKNSPRNSFDLLRLLAATAVLYSHQHILLGLPEPEVLGVKTLGFFGVVIFFILSGWLIAQSWERDPSPFHFLAKRVLRIFPALIVVVLLSVFALGPIFTSLPLSEYFHAQGSWRYLTTALLWVQHELPGVFEQNPFKQSVNGSLWTLPVEFLLYLSVLFAGLFGFFKKWFIPFGLLFLAAFLPFFLPNSDTLLTGAECLFVFWWGVGLGFERRSSRELKNKMLALLLLALVILGLSLHGAGFPALVLLAAFLILIAARFDQGQKLTGKMGDFSYGVYIFAFPVQQMLISALGARALPFAVYLFLSLICTYGLAALSWHFIEKPCMRLKPRR